MSGTIGDWLAGMASTPAGAQLGTALALVSALTHASFGALQKGRHDPWISRGTIDFFSFAFTLPLALAFAPRPTARGWAVLGAAMVIHFVYKMAMALAYERAAYTVVYPVVRGTGPLVTVAAASLVFHEVFKPLQWLGVAGLSCGILGLAMLNLRHERINPRALRTGLAFALFGGLTVAIYTTWDAWGIRNAQTPFAFLAWFFVVGSLDFPVIAFRRYRRMGNPPPLRPLMAKGVAGALIAYLSFGGVMLATYLDKVGEAAVLRETSTVFAAGIGWVVLGETVGWRRAALMALIATGAVLVELGR